MKRQFYAGLMSLAVAHTALATDLGYTNNAIISTTIPPQIDAYNFVNNATFSVSELLFLTNTVISLTFTPFETANTTNYINRGIMASGTGFQFDTFNTQTHQRQMAASFLNESSGLINCGTTTSSLTNVGFLALQSGSRCVVSATNITNRGLIALGPDSLINLQGRNIDLAGGLLDMQGFESGQIILAGNITTTLFLSSGMFDGYWGVGTTRTMVPQFDLSPNFALSPLHTVTNRSYLTMQQQIFLSGADNYVTDVMTDPSNRVVQVAFVSEPNPAITTHAYFFQGEMVVEWNWTATNFITGAVATNYLYLWDTFGAVTNLQVITNAIAAPSTGYWPSFIPTNYSFLRYTAPLFFNPATPGGLTPFTFNAGRVTNEYTAYEALFLPTTVIPTEVAGQTLGNMPGRTEITAGQSLTLDRARISSLNYLRISATNHFTSNDRTRIVTPFADFDLHTTNGVLAFTNLLAPTVPRMQGYVDLFSARWTNVANVVSATTNTVTNFYTVLLVDSHLTTSVAPQLNSLKLGSTNVIISDILNVVSNLVIDAEQLNILANPPGANPPAGELRLLSGTILGPANFPRLQYLTNSGTIQNFNVAIFRGERRPPYYPTSFDEPLQAFVNFGSILNEGTTVWANYIQNSGSLVANSSPILLQSLATELSGGSTTSANPQGGDIAILSGSLNVRNHPIQAGRALSLFITNSLDDGGTPNIWKVGSGLNLPILPTIGNLLGTTVTSTAPAFAEVTSQWAGRDRGVSPAGFANNAALGRLILDGGDQSQFIFTGTGSNNAIYLDYLELRDYTTNRDSGGNLLGLQIGNNMRIYYAQAVMNGVSVAEKLNHKHGDRLRWVPSYAGRFSSTDVVYPDGTTNRLNAALVASCNLDSNNNGLVNCVDPAPVLVANQLQFTITVTNQPPPAVLLSWQTIGRSTNSVYFRTPVTSTNWQLLTNFVFGPLNGPATVLDPVSSTPRFYRVTVEVPQP